jgi:hypothetical protein
MASATRFRDKEIDSDLSDSHRDGLDHDHGHHCRMTVRRRMIVPVKHIPPHEWVWCRVVEVPIRPKRHVHLQSRMMMLRNGHNRQTDGPTKHGLQSAMCENPVAG